MIDFIRDIIKPTTKDKQESYYEYLAREQPSKVKSTADQPLSLGGQSTPQQLQHIFYQCFKTINSLVMVLVNWYDPEYPKRSWWVFEAEPIYQQAIILQLINYGIWCCRCEFRHIR
jgi:hypothetical protein